MKLTPEIHARLLSHARDAIANYLSGREPPAINADWPELPRCGAFVTIRKFGRLRGCIGVFSADDDLPTTVARMAVSAARDPRFVDIPLSLAELKDLTVEISLLSPLTRIDNPFDFELGRHGIYVRHGHHIGCFLPDVATERNWDKETFLGQCCQLKAGLPPNAWKEHGTEVHIFSVEKFAG